MYKELLPTPEYLRSRFYYDTKKGDLYWLESSAMPESWNARFAGTKAGGVNKSRGYLEVRVDYSRYKAHRIIWAINYGYWPNCDIDHIDGDKSNNRIENLRQVHALGNAQNQAIPRNNTSGFIGVTRNNRGDRWVAQIVANGRRRYLGCFVNLSDAISARKSAEIELGFHENHGRAAIAAKNPR